MRFLIGVLSIGTIIGIVIVGRYSWDIARFLYGRYFKKRDIDLKIETPLEMLNRGDLNERLSPGLGNVIMIWVTISLLITMIQISPFGVERIGHIIERDEYTTYYFGTIQNDDLSDTHDVVVKLHVVDDDITPLEIRLFSGEYLTVEEYAAWEIDYDGFNVVFGEIEIVDEFGRRRWLQLIDQKAEEFWD